MAKSFIWEPLPPLEVRLTSTVVRAYCLKAGRSSKSESSSWFVSIGYQLHRHLRGRSLRHPRQLLVAWQSGPALILFCKSVLPCAEIPAGCVISIGLPLCQQLVGRDETILFWRERGSRACCFQNEKLYSPTPSLSRFPARVTTTALPTMFQHFVWKVHSDTWKRQRVQPIFVGQSA